MKKLLILLILLLPATALADLTGTEGLAIDLSSAGAGTDFTIAFDPTELLGSRTWGDASTDTIVWTWNRATGTDPTFTFGNGLVQTNGGLTVDLDLIITGGDITLGTTSIFSGGDVASLNNIDAINATTETTLEAAIDALTNLVTVGTIGTGTWQATDVGVAYGGTGASTFTDGGILLGSGAGAFTVLGVATNGQIPIGDGATDPVLATITGTASEVTVTNGAGTITLSLPDPIVVDVTGVASTATALATARAIGGVNFDGTAAITPTTIVVADTEDATSFIGMWTDATGSLLPKTDEQLTYVANTGVLTAAGFAGPLTGAVTGNADTATLASTVTTADDEATDDNQEVIFTTTPAGAATLETDGDFYYNPSSGTLGATEFVGGGVGVTGVDAATGDSATAFFDAGTLENARLDADLQTLATPTNWRVFYSNGGATITELALGASGTYLKSTGAAAAPEWDSPAGGGDMLKATYDIGTTGGVNVITTVDSTYAGDYVMLVGAATGQLTPKTDGALLYDATTGILSATDFAGTGASLTAVDAVTGDSATDFFDAGSIADARIDNDITIDLATLATTVTVTDDEATDDGQEVVFTTDNANLESDGDLSYNPSSGTLTATMVSANLTTTTNIVSEPKHLVFTIIDPLSTQTEDNEICIWPVTPAALTVTKIVVTLNAGANEVAGDLKWADAFIGLANATVINTFDTTTGVLSDDSITAGAVASGKAMYIAFDSAPNTAITQMCVDITFDYDAVP